MRTSIWLLHHGQTQANLARRYQSRSDSSLTAYGGQQTAALALRLRRTPFSLALASPASRTRLTAEAVLAGRRTTVPLQLDPAWAEIDQGNWEGLTYREVLARYPGAAQARWSAGLHGRAKDGESLAEVYARVSAAWQRLLHTQRGARILIATHATPIQLVLCLCSGMAPTEHWRWRIDLGSFTAIDSYGSGMIIRTVNHVPPLVQAEA